jgi:hypothetical protein
MPHSRGCRRAQRGARNHRHRAKQQRHTQHFHRGTHQYFLLRCEPVANCPATRRVLARRRVRRSPFQERPPSHEVVAGIPQAEALVLPQGCCVVAVIEHRAFQKKALQRRIVTGASEQGNASGEPSPSAAPCENEAVRIRPDHLGIVECPVESGIAILYWWEPCTPGQACTQLQLQCHRAPAFVRCRGRSRRSDVR